MSAWTLASRPFPTPDHEVPFQNWLLQLVPDHDVPDQLKRRRNNELLAIQSAISREENGPFVGQTVEILVEGPSKAAARRAEDGPSRQLTGRTVCDRIAVFEGPDSLVGRIVPVEVYEVK